MSLTVDEDNLLIFVTYVKCAKSFAKPSDKCLQVQVSAGITIIYNTNTNKSILNHVSYNIISYVGQVSTTTGQYSSSNSSSKHQPNFFVRWFSKLMAFDFRFGEASYSRILEKRFVREATRKLLQEIMSTKKSSGTSCNCKY